MSDKNRYNVDKRKKYWNFIINMIHLLQLHSFDWKFLDSSLKIFILLIYTWKFKETM